MNLTDQVKERVRELFTKLTEVQQLEEEIDDIIGYAFFYGEAFNRYERILVGVLEKDTKRLREYDRDMSQSAKDLLDDLLYRTGRPSMEEQRQYLADLYWVYQALCRAARYDEEELDLEFPIQEVLPSVEA